MNFEKQRKSRIPAKTRLNEIETYYQAQSSLVRETLVRYLLTNKANKQATKHVRYK